MIYRPRHFELQELVCPHVYNDRILRSLAWTFFDERLFMTIDFLRDHLGEMIINNWHIGGSESQRGLRCIQCKLVKDATEDGRVYCSAHIRGQAVDFNIKGMTDEKVSLWVMDNQMIFPFWVRMEKNTAGWTHIDICNTGTTKNPVELVIVKK